MNRRQFMASLAAAGILPSTLLEEETLILGKEFFLEDLTEDIRKRHKDPVYANPRFVEYMKDSRIFKWVSHQPMVKAVRDKQTSHLIFWIKKDYHWNSGDGVTSVDISIESKNVELEPMLPGMRMDGQIAFIADGLEKMIIDKIREEIPSEELPCSCSLADRLFMPCSESMFGPMGAHWKGIDEVAQSMGGIYEFPAFIIAHPDEPMPTCEPLKDHPAPKNPETIPYFTETFCTSGLYRSQFMPRGEIIMGAGSHQLSYGLVLSSSKMVKTNQPHHGYHAMELSLDLVNPSALRRVIVDSHSFSEATRDRATND